MSTRDSNYSSAIRSRFGSTPSLDTRRARKEDQKETPGVALRPTMNHRQQRENLLSDQRQVRAYTIDCSSSIYFFRSVNRRGARRRRARAVRSARDALVSAVLLRSRYNLCRSCVPAVLVARSRHIIAITTGASEKDRLSLLRFLLHAHARSHASLMIVMLLPRTSRVDRNDDKKR